LYNLFKYLTPRQLEAQNIYNFDSWANVFAIKTAEYEVSITNDIIIKERFRKFIKVPELAANYRQITHFISQKELKIERPKMVSVLVNIPQTQDQKNFNKLLMEFVKTGDGTLIGRNKLSNAEETAKMLIATNTAKKMALDMRLVNPSAEDNPGNKLSVCANRIAEIYGQYNDVKGTQLIFCDVGTPTAVGFNLYDELKRKLVEEHGIAVGEIKFIHDATTTLAREKLFDKMNTGEYRILIGSTKKMGTGVNCQRRVVAMHHLDIPWTPKDLEQRNGRGIRQGNMIAKEYADNEVKVYTYAVEQTLDAYKFNLLKNKQFFIDQIKNNSISIRSVDEGSLDESTGMPFAEFLAVISGNTDLLELVKLEKKIAQLESENKLLEQQKLKQQEKISDISAILKTKERFLEYAKSDLSIYYTNIVFDVKSKSKINTIKIANIDLSETTAKEIKAEIIGREVLKAYKSKVTKITKIGELYGFDLYVKPNGAQGNILLAKSPSGTIEYTSNNGIPNENESYAARYFHNAIDKVTVIFESYTKETKNYRDNLHALSVYDSDKEAIKKLQELEELKQRHRDVEEKIQKTIEIKTTDNKVNKSIADHSIKI